MIYLEVYPARTYYSGPDEDVEAMVRGLRIRDKNAYFKARAIINRLGYISPLRQEQIEESAKWIKFYDQRTSSFGTGLLHIVKRRLRKKHIKYKIEDLRKDLPDFDDDDIRFEFLDEVEERPEQLEVLGEAVRKGSGILHCSVNFGKTEVASAIIQIVGEKLGRTPRVLFLVHRLGLVRQTAERFKRHLGIKVSILDANNKRPGRVTVATTQTAISLLERNSSRFRKCLKRCFLVFVDELHVNKAKSVQTIMNNCSARMRFGLSGTISKEKAKLLQYMSMTGPIIAEVTSRELIALGRSAKPFIRLLRFGGEEVKGHGYRDSYRLGVIEHRERNRQVVKETLRYLDKGLKNVMVTVSRIPHGRELLRKFQDRDLPVEFIHGNTPLDIRDKIIRRFTRGKIPILIVSPIFDTGMDVPEIRAWVNAAGGLGWELVIQRLGRTLRKKKEGKNEVYITDFLDFHNMYLLKHATKRFEYYAEEQAEMKIIDRR